MRVTVSTRTIDMPHACACCLTRTESHLPVTHTRTSGKKVIREDTRAWDFPYCETCIEHVRLWNLSASTVSALVLLALLALVVGFFSSAFFWVSGGLVILSIVTAVMMNNQARQHSTESCSSLGSAVVFQGRSGTVNDFEISNEEFAKMFADLNSAKTVTASSDLRTVTRTGRSKRQ